ncbi:MAG: tetratricopeptide repeat protein [Verrucomicrobia bacterium]|nr:tetratricopeptide repeat protein [Verrucomicrobiota bacterium]
MSRFVNLEFDDQFEDRSDASEVVKDEAYYFSQGQAAFENGQFEQALRLFAKVLEHNPQNAAAWTGQVRMLIELGEFREAKLWADKALERFPVEPELLAAKAVALGRSGDLQAALAFSDASIEERGDTPYIWLARGDVLLAREEKRATYCFEKAHLLSPDNWFYAWLTSRIYFFYQKFSLAFKFAQQALTLDSGQGAIWLQVGQCQMALGLVDPARNSFEQARQLNHNSLEVNEALVRLSKIGLWSKLRRQGRQLFSQ